jgi:glycosyltransferase involved in cell wall biosynthesis
MTNSVQVCTVATLAQLPSARVLDASLRTHHPDAELTVLVLDGEAREHDPSGPRLVSPVDVGVPPDELARRAVACAAPELADALTPRLVEYLFAEGASVVIAMRPETEVFAPLHEVVGLAEEHGVVLAPRSDAPVPDDGLEPSPGEADAAGPFAPGFVAVAAGSPAMAPVHVLRDPGCTVSAWNLHNRDLRAADDGYEVAGRPLRWFDFTGYSPEVPHLLSTDYERPRIRLSDRPALARLCDEHGARLRDAGYHAGQPGYGFDALPGGRKIDARMRRMYADALRDAADDGDSEPQSPFGPDGADAFAAWINEPVAPPADPLVSRYLARVRDEEPVLRELFPSIAGEGAEAYLGALRDERNPYDIPEWVLPTEEEVVELMWRRWRARPAGPRPRGVNVVGYVTAVVGVGHVARVFASSLDAAGVPAAVVANEETTSEKVLSFDTRRARDAPYDVNLVCVNADHTALLADQLGPDFFAGRRTIGVWAWEVEDFPAASISAFDLVDEVWVGSDFEFEAIAPVASKPVRKHPPPVVVPVAPPGASRAQLGLPDDRFLFLFVYDYLSTAERKNPVGLIEAYTRAFGPDDRAVLVLKSINGDKRVDQLERVRRAAAGRPDVIVRDEYLSPDLHAVLLTQCDAYVSLHRSEGFGLDLAAAMGLGKPVIATGYSGNLEFMADDTAFLVDYDLEPVGPGNDPYPADSRWARPRIDHAAELMRRVVEQPDEARERGRRAAASVRADFSLETRSAALARMVDDARARPARQGSWRRFFTERWRAERHQAGHLPYGRFWLPDGTPLDRTMRRLLASRDGARAPDPELDLSEFYAWLNEPVFPPASPVVSRYLHELWRDRPDLQSHFPTIDSDPRGYLEWLIEHGHADTDVPYQLLPLRDALSSLTRYQERQARRERLLRVFRTAGRRAAEVVTRRQ